MFEQSFEPESEIDYEEILYALDDFPKYILYTNNPNYPIIVLFEKNPDLAIDVFNKYKSEGYKVSLNFIHPFHISMQ